MLEKLFNGGNDTITPIDRTAGHVTGNLCTQHNPDSIGPPALKGESLVSFCIYLNYSFHFLTVKSSIPQ